MHLRFRHLLTQTVALISLMTPPLSAGSLQEDIEYAKIGDRSLKLDLHYPKQPDPPLIVYVHGGGWASGSKADMPLAGLLREGFAVASVDYRLSGEARFPAQIHDIKAAIRFLRARHEELHIRTDRIFIAGSSAGGHLAALVGVTNGHPELEGKVGEHLDQSSAVQGIISFFGASNLRTILSQSTERGLQMRVPALQRLLGGLPEETPELARLASPVFQVDAQDPPLLLIHGDADPQMPPEQSTELAQAYQKAGLKVRHVVLSGPSMAARSFTTASG